MSERSLLYGASVLTGSAIATQLMSFAYRVLLARMMGSGAMGVYHLVMSVYSVMMSVCLTGLSTASSRLSAQLKATGRQSRINQLIKKLFYIFAVTALCACAVLLLGDGFISDKVLNESRARSSIVLLVPVILLTGIENILKNHFIGVGNVLPEAVCETVEMAVRALAAVVLLITFKPAGAEGAVACVILAMVISEIFSSCAMLIIYKRSQRKQPRINEPSAKLGRDIASIALPAALTSFVSNLLSSANNILIPIKLVISGMEKTEAMSAMGTFFGMTLPMAALPAILIEGLLGVLMPSLSDHMARGELKAVRRKISKSFLGVTIYIVPALTIMIPLFPDFAKLLYASSEASEHIFLLCIWLAVCSVRSVSAVVMTGIGKQALGALNFIIGTLVQLLFTWFLAPLPELRLEGVALGMIASAVVTFVLNLYFICKSTHLKVRFAAWFVCPVVSAAGAYTLAALMAEFFVLPCPALLRAAVTAVAYIVLLRAMGIKLSSLLVLGKKMPQN